MSETSLPADPAAPGSPAWWASRERPAEPPTTRGRGRPPRSLDDMVDAAVAVIDEHGAPGFNMRLLADRLGASTATLYRHVTGKEELFVLAVDRLLGEVLGADDDRVSSWQDALRRLATAYRDFFDAHPNVTPLLVAQLPVGPNALAIRERTLAELTRFDLSPALAARAFTTVVQYVLGHSTTGPGSPDPAEAAVIAEYYRSLDPGTYPHVAAAAAVLTETTVHEEFRAGVEIVIEGIGQVRESRTAADRPG